MGDRAHYFLDQSVPELLDLQEKKIFSPLEIKSIARKRISFENALTRKIVRKTDFLKYAEYEINLEALRVQRVKRLRLKSKQQTISDWAGPQRIFFIFERATRRFHGDVNLWLQYIDYAKQQKSNKMISRAFKALLQYHPTNPSVWTLAAEHEMMWNGSMTAARTLVQRGLRLNTGSRQLWLDYFRLELAYLGTIYDRRKITGMDTQAVAEDVDLDTQNTGDENSDTIALPVITRAELDSTSVAQDALSKAIELSSLSTAASDPQLQGAVPRTIFTMSLKAMPDNAQLIFEFYETLLPFTNLPFREELLSDIVDHLSAGSFASLPQACFLRVILPCTRLQNDVTRAEFPDAFRSSLQQYARAEAETTSLLDLVSYWTEFLITKLLVVPHIDKSLKKAICLTARKAFKSADLTPELYKLWIKFELDHGNSQASTALMNEAAVKFKR